MPKLQGHIQFLNHLASQLKIGKDPASRRAIERILDTVRQDYESGKYQNPTDAERAFRRTVGEQEESA
jgi:hypothetical protein